ncbi:MAG: glycosyltransferase, partial [Candidatus Poseidoniaceae archaeon]|nr:glycosyltransferase [Candidatus Poseidoniaceae archaeon]
PSGLAQELLSSAENLGIIHRIKWFDRIENDNMSQIYSMAAMSGGFNLVTSHCESFGMSVLESLLSRCPVICTNVGALSELAEESDWFKMYNLGDAEKAIEIGLSMLDEFPPSRNGNLRNNLIQRFSSEKRSPEYWELLGKLTQENLQIRQSFHQSISMD